MKAIETYREAIIDMGIPEEDIFSPGDRLAVRYMQVVHGGWQVLTDWLDTAEEAEAFLNALTDGIKLAAIA